MRNYSKSTGEQKEKWNQYQITWRKTKRDSNPLFALETNIRVSFNKLMKVGGYGPKSKLNQIIGCSFDEYITHIESTFEPGMNWDLYGRNKGCFGIDHIISLSTAKSEEELIKLFHWTNTRAMWCSENTRKGNKS